MSIVNDPERLMFGYIAGRYGPPAFVRRQQCVDAAWQVVLNDCRAEYERLLKPVRGQILVVAAALGLPIDAEFEPANALTVIFKVAKTRWHGSHQMPRRARIEMDRLVASVHRFNRRWVEFVETVDLKEVNRLRDGYNRYYVLEKECALRSERLARLGFEPLRPATHAELFDRYVKLPVMLVE